MVDIFTHENIYLIARILKNGIVEYQLVNDLNTDKFYYHTLLSHFFFKICKNIPMNIKAITLEMV